MEREREVTSYEDLREIAALRHSFHIDSRLRLEFLSVVSKLLREHEVPVSNRVLSTLVLAVPDELPDGNGHQQDRHDAQLAVQERSKSGRAGKAGKKTQKVPATPLPPGRSRPPMEPNPPPMEPIPPPMEPIPPPMEPIPPLEPIPPYPPMQPKRSPSPPMRKGRKY